MTGEKNRFATHEKLWKQEDGQLTTPKHDEMVLDLLDKDYMSTLLESNERTREVLASNKIVDKVSFQDRWAGVPYMKWMANDMRPTDEYCVELGKRLSSLENGTGRYNDYSIRYSEYWKDIYDDLKKAEFYTGMNTLNIWNIDANSFKAFTDYPIKDRFRILSEVPVLNRDFIIGYWDVIVNIESHASGDMGAVCEFRGNTEIDIEVKPKITSFGETLRQLNTYRNYVKSGYDMNNVKTDHVICLYTYDTVFKAAFESQGITVLNPLK